MSAAERMPPCRQWMLMVGLRFLFVYSIKSVSFWVWKSHLHPQPPLRIWWWCVCGVWYVCGVRQGSVVAGIHTPYLCVCVVCLCVCGGGGEAGEWGCRKEEFTRLICVCVCGVFVCVGGGEAGQWECRKEEFTRPISGYQETLHPESESMFPDIWDGRRGLSASSGPALPPVSWVWGVEGGPL